MSRGSLTLFKTQVPIFLVSLNFMSHIPSFQFIFQTSNVPVISRFQCG